MNPYKAVLFDFDGVIANTVPIFRQAFFQFFKKENYTIDESDFENQNWATKSLEQLCKILLEKYGIVLDVDTIRRETWQTQKDLMRHHLESDPSLLPFLIYCRENWIHIAIGSNSISDRIIWVLDMMNILDFFTLVAKHPLEKGGRTKRMKLGDLETSNKENLAIIWANDLTHHKPDPEVWLKCADLLGVPITDCLVIEDGLPWLTWAKQCGARGIYYHRFCPSEKACEEIAEKNVGSFGELLK